MSAPAAASSTTSTKCKDFSQEMAAGYNPAEVESGWGQWWENKGYFHPRSDTQGVEVQEKHGKFVIVLPPPNITGRLHLGHALTTAVQDTICRFQRMEGKDVLYVPGADHAGIATQVVVEKRLQATEGLSRHDLGREKFLEKVWEHKASYSNFIHDQLHLLGSSCDWSRDRFTMDDQCAAAVKEAFVRLYEDGKIYRATRLVNWCCALQSAISDLEVDFEEVAPKSKTTVPGYDRMVDMGLLTHFAYPVDGEEGAELIVATTRPETILGDTAVAVHPDDERYKRFHGKFVKCPFRDEKIPIICDSTLVDMNFGTGVVKVTPAHDPNDFECGQRNNLPQLVVFDLKGFVCFPGEFQGMHRFAARWHVVEALKNKGLLKEVVPHANRVPRCSRTKDIVEPMIMPQWFVDCREMAKMSLEAVEKGDLKLTPDNHIVTWKHFLENIKPWCVSRQIWWGHRIPAYNVMLNGNPAPVPEGKDQEQANWVVARNLDEARIKAKKQLPNLTEEQFSQITFEQDPDVLDTWFSSALWPFSTMGWPNETNDMKRFFPGSLLETGHDILFFWVARMVMMSLHFFKKVPFSEVFLHAMVRDKDGQKMSKSKGNVIDPIDVMNGIELQALHDKLQGGNLDPKEHERAIKYQKGAFPKGIPECGSDALRFGLLSYTQSGRNVNLDIERIVGYRQFCNKLWNVTKYILYHALDRNFIPQSKLDPTERESYPLECRWILSRLDYTVQECASGMTPGTYDFHQATSNAYHFWLYEVCDVFLELTKPVMADPNAGPRKTLTQTVLLHVVEAGLRLLHPMMPFVTEELYHRLPHHSTLPSESIMMAEYPKPAGWRDTVAEEQMKMVNEIVHAFRSLKGQYTLTNKVKPDCWIAFGDAKIQSIIAPQTSLIETLAYLGKVTAIAKADEAKEGVLPLGCAFALAFTDVGCHMSIKDYIDPVKEVAKLAKQIDILEKSKQGLEKKMQIADYEAKVPADVRSQNDAKLKQLDLDIKAAQTAKSKMEELTKSA